MIINLPFFHLTRPFLRDQLRTPPIVVNPSMLQNTMQITTTITMNMFLLLLKLLQVWLFQLLQELLEAVLNLLSPNLISITLSQTSMNSHSNHNRGIVKLTIFSDESMVTHIFEITKKPSSIAFSVKKMFSQWCQQEVVNLWHFKSQG